MTWLILKTGYQTQTEENYSTCRHQQFEDGSTKENKKQSGCLVDSINAEHPSIDVAISSIIFRSDDQSLNSTEIDEVNRQLSSFYQSKNWDFTDNSNIKEDS